MCFMIISGCAIANTPTAKVEDYLSKYQKLDTDISINYQQLSLDEELTQEQKHLYQELIKKQYKNLSYEVKEETIDGKTASVITQIQVYDYKEILNKYNKDDYDDIKQYHDILTKSLNNQKDKITYTVTIELNKNDKDEWKVIGLNEDERKKLLGIN